MFTPLDLSERKKDIQQVIQNIYAVDRQAQAMRLNIPQLGVRYYATVADQQRREQRRQRERVAEAKAREETNVMLAAKREAAESRAIQRYGKCSALMFPLSILCCLISVLCLLPLCLFFIFNR